ncbi:hypothetical protein [Streptomonospora wellingtoniae]|uniref:Uncharacterized protein n=1 Tax=Streptomonospora wellingtoniae TaxID=3075544 RepID=A0ABU2KQ74_9ACTN|nr:hypothetical protein [Streptomonospora sp. DSM 45055]MDT0301425.1 hypothetical protein [Streptomonospora sp. DSM 45055]
MGDSDAFTEHSKLVPTCQKVRLVHAAIRELHRRSGEWDYEGMGTPVSQLYTAGAAAAPAASPEEGVGAGDGPRPLPAPGTALREGPPRSARRPRATVPG